jgi:hypothetical protein
MKKTAFLSGDYTNPTWHPFHGVDKELMGIFGDDFEIAKNSEHFESLHYEDYRNYDCFMLYTDHWVDKSQTCPDAAPAVVTYVTQVGNMIVLHSLGPAYDYETAQLIGAREAKPAEKMLIHYTPSSIGRPAELKPSTHPILEGIEEFSVEDELCFLHMDQFLEMEVLLYAKYGDNLFPMAWCHGFGLGRVVTVAAGHGVDAYRNTEFREFLKRCGLWATRRL